MKRNTLGLGKLVRRIFALALTALMGFQLLPGTARADETDSMWKTLDNTQQTVSAGKAVSNTYILEVSSGSRLGGGPADNVQYFIISYTASDGQSRTVVLVPGEDAVSQGFKIAAAQGNREDRRKTVERVFGYSTEALGDKRALSSLETDQYLFTTPASIRSIDKIQVFGMRNEQHGDWACQGMRLYRVDTLYGLEMYGWYSDKGYIDFDGSLIARVEMAPGGVIFKWISIPLSSPAAWCSASTSQTWRGRASSPWPAPMMPRGAKPGSAT